MWKGRCKIVIVMVIFINLSLTGCVTFPKEKGMEPAETTLTVASSLRFEDVPIPKGFKLLQKESFAFQTDILRVGLLRYTGRTPGQRVVDFYQQQMPLYNWRPINLIEYGKWIMNFTKAGEDCVVTIEAAGRKTNIFISISPKTKEVGAVKSVTE